MLRAGIYPRVSTIRQVKEGFSLEAQRENLTYYAKNQGWEVVGDYGDEGISGKNVQNRPGVKRLIKDIKLKKIDIVVLYKFDRLTRDSRDTEDFIELIQEYDITVYTISGGIVDVSTPSGRFNTRILGAAAQFERETTIDRVVDGFIKKVKNGYSLCSSTPSYGYDRPKHQEVQTINDKEANVVRKVFNLYLKDKSFTEIADILNFENIKTKKNGKIMKKRNSDEYYVVNSIWQPKTIRQMLSNPNYIGNVRYGINRVQVSLEDAAKYENRKKGFIASGIHDPIIDIDVWNKVQKKLGKIKRVSKTNYTKEDIYYCGFLTCGFCGHTLTTNRTNKRRKDGTKTVFLGYRCINREKKLCPALGMSHKKVEEAFLAYIENLEELDDFSEIKLEDNSKDNSELNLNKKMLLQKNFKLKEVMNLFMDSKIEFNEYQEMKNSLEKELNKLQLEIQKLENNLNNKEVKYDKKGISKNIKKHWQYLTNSEKREFLTNFIEEIIIVNKDRAKNNGKVTILDVKFYDEYYVN